MIPEKLNAFRVYANDGKDLLGVADVTLPKLEPLSEEIEGAGIAGKFKSITPGHYGPMSVELSWGTVHPDALKLQAPKEHDLDLRGDQKVTDPGTGEIKHEAVRVRVRGTPANGDLGKFKTGSLTETKMEFEVLYLKIEVGGEELVEIDKRNHIAKIDGVDYLAEERTNLGLQG